MLNWVRRWTSQEIVWPEIDYELIDVKERGLLRGVVLNAGCGWRDISHLVQGTLVNQDIDWPNDWPNDSRTKVNIFSPLHDIPRSSGSFDIVICIAVLEHVENPEEVTAEMFRVLKLGGYLIATVPFLQPEHKCPTDFQRYTRDGLAALMERHGFIVEEIKPLFSLYHTLHWITYECLHIKNSFIWKVLRVLLLPPLAILARKSDLVSDKVATAFRVIAKKG
jgi:SAM-dependent methyltransferase